MHKNSGFKGTFTCSNCPIYQKSNYFMISILNKTKKTFKWFKFVAHPFLRNFVVILSLTRKIFPSITYVTILFLPQKDFASIAYSMTERHKPSHLVFKAYISNRTIIICIKKDLNDFKKSLNHVQNISFVFPFSLIIVRNSKQYIYFK